MNITQNYPYFDIEFDSFEERSAFKNYCSLTGIDEIELLQKHGEYIWTDCSLICSLNEKFGEKRNIFKKAAIAFKELMEK